MSSATFSAVTTEVAHAGASIVNPPGAASISPLPFPKLPWCVVGPQAAPNASNPMIVFDMAGLPVRAETVEASIVHLKRQVALRESRSVLHNAIMLACILPIAFVANITRVIILVLITYYFGDAAGQGFLHGTAGMVLMVAALLFLFLVDGALVRVLREKPRA